MSKHSHHFVDAYRGFVGLGFNRETDERTIQYYLQKFSDDKLMENLLGKLSDDELEQIFILLSRLLKTHLSAPEYHHLFLKDGDWKK